MTERCVIKVVALADGRPCQPAGFYVAGFDADAHGGQGEALMVADPRDALVFHGRAAAFEFWKTPSAEVPLRPDGRPNRPLTAYTVEFVKVAHSREGSA